MPRGPELRPLAALAALAVAALLAAAGGEGAGERQHVQAGAGAWRGLVGTERADVVVGDRMVVVLRYPSLADRVRRAGGSATEASMRRWTAAALAGQKQIAARLSEKGIRLEPEYIYTRVLNGFSAPLDARGLALLERDPDVVGIYPVRPGYPATTSSRLLDSADLASGRRAAFRLGELDGSGVTVALLDTGVDRSHPYLRNRLARGIDILDPEGSAMPRRNPYDPAQVERHGTELAGLLAGGGGPDGLAGIAPGATIQPIRVAGWQPDAAGGFAVYARTDQLLAGLERAVDPDGNGDAHDAARIALVGVAEPFAAFADGPLARAAAGAAALDTLVVAAAGNDGPAGPGYGSVAGPGGAPSALTVGAADLRARTQIARVVVRAGLRVLLDERLPLAGATAPAEPLTLAISVPRPADAQESTAGLDRFFDPRGFSLVAGSAALVRADEGPANGLHGASIAGARAVLVDRPVPPGAFGIDARVSIPSVGLPATVAGAVRRAIARGARVSVSIGRGDPVVNSLVGRVAAFSSRGLAFGGGLKPELVAPGVELLTSVVGRDEDGAARYGTVNGSSAAAAVAAGAAALLAQARPELDAAALKSVLVSTSRPLAGDGPSAQGAGLLDVGGASAAELATSPATVSFGVARGAGWEATRPLLLRNVSTRAIVVRLESPAQGVSGVVVAVEPRRVRIAPGRSASVTLTASSSAVPARPGAAAGHVTLLTAGAALSIPWAVALAPAESPLLDDVRLSVSSFRASDNAPAVVSLRAGTLGATGTEPQVQPVERLDVELWRDGRRIGLLARLRDVLPGRYVFGLTGRGPRGARLAAGAYRLRIVAFPPGGSAPSVARLRFTIR